MKIIAVDFDDTLCFSDWPNLGEPNVRLINFLKEWRDKDNKLILWTCRNGSALDLAIDWCKNQGLEFDAINENIPETIAIYGNDSRKISADLYIDDRSIMPNQIKRELIKELN